MKKDMTVLPERTVYDDPDYPVKTEFLRFTDSSRYSATPHLHVDLEFLFVCKGTLLVHVDGETLELQEGHGAYIGSRKLHFLVPAKKEDCCFIRILFHPVLLGLHSVIDKKYVWPLRTSLSFMRLTPEVSWQKDILDHIEAAYRSRDSDGALLEITGRMYIIWGLLYQHCPASRKPSDTFEAQMSSLRHMTDFIYKNYGKKITLADIAKAGNMCKTQCTKVFHDFLGITPVEYLISQRLSKSTELFREAPHMTMTEVALACGFSSSSFFAESFRKHYGCSPTQYKKEQGLQ